MTEPERLLTPGEVAALFRVDPKSVGRWAASGVLPFVRTPGGHRRHRKSVVDALLSEATGKAPGPLLTTQEVATLFRVHPMSVTRWADRKKLTTVRTPGNHRRFLQSEIDALLGAAPAVEETAEAASAAGTFPVAA
jgi:excisionase family DNA binding protein